MAAPELSAERPLLYSPTTVDHFRHPRNVGRVDSPDASGFVDDFDTENSISFTLRVADGRIAEIRFRTFGCSACIAASSIATVLATGLTRGQARQLTARRILSALDGLPPDKQHCARLAAQALAAALDDYTQHHPRR